MSRSAATIGQLLTFLITFLIKIVGLASAFNQLLIQQQPTSLALWVSAFMMAGAQVSESLILILLERLAKPDGAGPPEKLPEGPAK